MTTRSPTPWSAGVLGSGETGTPEVCVWFKAPDTRDYVVAHGENCQSNAAHIVRCVNAHDDLVAACRLVLDGEWIGGCSLPDSTIAAVSAALRKAEA